MISVVLTGRNDNYGGSFEDRLLGAMAHNSRLFAELGIPFEFVFVEWNPIPSKTLLSEKICNRFPTARAIVVPPEIHQVYTTNPHMPFCEMPAKNVGIRNASGDTILILNGDILLSCEIAERFATLVPESRCFYRCQRVDIQPVDLTSGFHEETVNVIPNGEERRPPVRYMGAGGDFCFARKSLFMEMTGYDEDTRFTTRAKDWQFFQSALRRRIAIEFIGKAYHLDHQEGFRHAPEDSKNTSKAHFGGYWNFSFELPYCNASNWGFSDLKLINSQHPRIRMLEPGGNLASRWDANLDLQKQQSLLPQNSWSGAKGALLMHLAFLLESGQLEKNPAIRLIQADTIAQWKVICDTVELNPSSILKNGAETNKGESEILETEDDFTGPLGELEPIWGRLKEARPEFNPFLLTRLIRAYRHFAKSGARNLAIFGAGQHTEQVMRIQLPSAFLAVAILQSRKSDERCDKFGLPVYIPDELKLHRYDAVLLSSVSFETEMKAVADQQKLNRVYSLYGSE